MIFALAHMSCGGAWAWGDVPARLRSAGHEVVAPDLDLSAGQTPGTHAAALAAAVGPGPVAVAGHSYGALVALPLADLLRDRVTAVTVIDGPVVDPGQSMFDVRPEHAEARRSEAAADGYWRGEDPRMRPMPISASEAPVPFRAVDVPRTFVHCLRSDMGEQAERARARGWRIVEVDAGHGLPLEDPATCAALLLS